VKVKKESYLYCYIHGGNSKLFCSQFFPTKEKHWNHGDNEDIFTVTITPCEGHKNYVILRTHRFYM